MFDSLKKLRIFSFLICLIIITNIFSANASAATLERVEDIDNYIVFFNDNYVDKRQTFISDLKKADIKYEILDEFSSFIQGYRLKLNREDAKKIETWKGIESISQEKKYTNFEIKKKSSRHKRDIESNKIIGQDKLNSEYDGRGMVVAVIDSGGDVNHPDFRLDEGVESRLTEEKVDELIKSGKIQGQYVNKKIPFVRDYVGLDNDIKESAKESHGMHVAGIIGANPKEERNNVVKGVIPNSQLVLMKVFGSNGGASSGAYVKAIHDAILLEVDSINMSLGVGGGSILLEDPAVSKAINLAKEKGISISIAGGNDGYYGWGKSLPDIRYPDYGVTAMPGINTSGLTVASIENTKQQVEQFEVENGNNISHNVINNIERLKDRESYHNGFKEVVFKEMGEDEDFDSNEDLTGKIVVIKRGKNTFKEKIANASRRGADFVIIENYEAEGNNFVSMEVEKNNVASTMITYGDGQYLRSLSNPKIRISEYAFSMENPNSGKLSEFSSWGITADGDLKPDITAPGGKIYSTINDGAYNSQSGTSMASPHVAGAIAVMNKMVADKFPGINGSEKHKLVKNLLMNSALPHIAANGEYSSPRQQGAGVLNLKRAMDISAIMYGESGTASVNLGNISADMANLKFTVENLTDMPVSYIGKIKLTTDTVVDNKFALLPQALGEEDLGVIKLEPKEKKLIERKIDVSKLNFPAVPNGRYLDGFVVLSSDSQMELSMPFTGFVGDWTNLRVIEESIYDLLKEKKLPLYAQDAKPESSGREHNFGGPAYEFTHLSTLRDNRHFVLGTNPGTNPSIYYDKNHIAISPNGDGINDHVRFNATFLRSYKDMSVKVTDEKEQKVLYTSLSKKGIKNFFGNEKNNDKVTVNDAWKWDGKEYRNYKDVADGKYKFIVTVKPVADNADEQKMEFPIIVDRVSPEVEKAHYDEANNVFRIESIKEILSGVRSVEAYYLEGDKRVELDIEHNDGYSISIPEGKRLSDIKLHIEDWAGNTYKHSLEESIRDENARLIVRTSLENGGEIPEYKVKISDENSNVVDSKDLKIGKSYKVNIEVLNSDYEVVGKKEEKIVFTKENSNIILHKVFRKIEFFDVSALTYREYKDFSNVNHKYDGDIKIKIVNVETDEEFVLEKDKEATSLDNMYSTKAKIGKYKPVAFDVKPGWKVRFDKDIINVEKRAGYANAFSFRAYYEKEAVKDKKKVYLQEAAANQYKDFIANPINFEFTNIKTGEKTEHTYGGLKNSLVKLEQGKYRVSLKGMPDWKLDISLANNNEIEVGASLFGNTTVIFKLTKIQSEPSEPKPDEKEKEIVKDKKSVYLQEAAANQYKDFIANPINFEFTNIKTGEKTEHTYGGIKNSLVKLEQGKYRVSLKGMPDWKLDISLANNNEIEVGASLFGNTTVIFKLTKIQLEPLKPKPDQSETPPVKKGKVWLQPGALNEYKEYSKENPIEFTFKNIQTSKVTTHKYGSVGDYNIVLEYGEYEVSAQIEGYEFKLDVAKNNRVKLSEDTLDHESAIFIFRKVKGNESVKPKPDESEIHKEPNYKKREIRIQVGYYNDYKDFSVERPIEFSFKNTSTGKVTKHLYTGVKDYKLMLEAGNYEVSAKADGYDFKLEVANNNTIVLDENSSEYESVIFVFKKIEGYIHNPKPQPELKPDKSDDAMPDKRDSDSQNSGNSSGLNNEDALNDLKTNNIKLQEDGRKTVNKLEKNMEGKRSADRELKNAPHTGDEFNLIYIATICGLLFITLIYLKKSKKL